MSVSHLSSRRDLEDIVSDGNHDTDDDHDVEDGLNAHYDVENI